MKEEKRKKAAPPIAGVDLAVPGADRTVERAVPAAGTLVAKKDFAIHHNDYRRIIRAGDDLSDIPESYLENLRTEGVL
jgi:hypothetical protein